MKKKKETEKKERSLTWLTLWLAFFIFLGIIGWVKLIAEAVASGQYLGALALLFPMLLFLAWFLWIMRRIMRTREGSRRRLEGGGTHHKIKDTLVFSLAWSREIFQNIPKDRRPLIYNAYLLIVLVVAVLIVNSLSLATILLVLLLILASTNLLVWVVGSERQEKNQMEVELDTARRMQMSLMPTSDFSCDPMDISGICQPSLQVGGDSFDFIHFSRQPDRVTISVVDVSGKGMAAALTAIYTSGAINSEISHQDHLEEAAANLNTAICGRKQKKQFVSVLLAEIDIPGRRLSFINAGQSRPLLLREGLVSVLKGTGSPLPLGVREEAVYQRNEIDLQNGDTLLFHTDGVTDAVNEENEMFGSDRLHTLLSELGTVTLSAKALVEAIRDHLAQFSGSAQQFDDITLVALRVT
jgi:serine phosphatase RsbU (regulator of sigma subunit)